MGLVYAPIIIPTLNRYVHLERCISSLQKNAWAKYTPLYISVDYPPDAKYEKGYEKVCQYLQRGIEGFASVQIFYQEHNLGAYDNEEFLVSEIRKQYDRYIFTEDDNQFSPNFIEFIDKGLELFKNNQDILSICGAGSAGEETIYDNIVLSTNYTAYGCGEWIEKRDVYQTKICRNYFVTIAYSYRKMLQLAKKDPSLLFSLQSAVLRKERLYQRPDGEIPIIDMTMKIYLVLEHKYVVASLKRKSRNWGYDGTGENCNGKEKNYLQQINADIDMREKFEYVYSQPMKIQQYKVRYSLETILRIVMVFVKLSIWRIKNGT